MLGRESRAIWRDVIDSLDRLRETSERRNHIYQEDPRRKIVGTEYDTDAIPLKVEEIDWKSIEIVFEGETPSRNDAWMEDTVDTWSEYNFEKCAWYISYHYMPRDRWGIHIEERCWYETAKKMYLQHPSQLSWTDSIKTAFLFIFLHEFFHYITDIASTVLEIVSQNPNVYENYTRGVYAATFGTPDCLEEALANRYLYGRAESFGIDRDYLYSLLCAMPPGYREFSNYLGPNFWRGRRRLMSQIKDARYKGTTYEPIEQVMELLTAWDYSHGHRVPLWLHRPPSSPFRIYIN